MGLISVYLSVVHPGVKNAPFHSRGGGDHGCTGLINHSGMYQRMYAARVLNICSLCYSAVPTIGGVPPSPRKTGAYIYNGSLMNLDDRHQYSCPRSQLPGVFSAFEHLGRVWRARHTMRMRFMRVCMGMSWCHAGI